MSFEIGSVIIQTLINHGFEAYFVGGAVRDSILGIEVDDIDIATSAPPEKVIEIFPKTIPVGIEHGTVIVRMRHLSFEVTTFRREGKYLDYRHPSSVDFVTSINEDLMRRDFTINAMALTIDGKLVDPFDGQVDLKRRVLRTVGEPNERFQEDPLRMMRGVRFISSLGFTLDECTKKSILGNNQLLENIAIERITVEFEKMLMGKFYTMAFQELVNSKLYQFLPGSMPAEGLIAFGSLEILQNITIEERWSLLLYKCQIRQLDHFLKQWKLPRQKLKKIISITNLINEKEINEINPWFVYKEGLDSAISFSKLKNILNQTEHSNEIIQEIGDKLSITNRRELAVNGTDLMQWINRKPGPWIEQLLEEIEKLVITKELPNERGGIKQWVTQRNLLEAD
jgi:tRNA nucleotidyltransferase (CCA-adding enzyme)